MWRGRIESFGHAIRGIGTLLRTQINARIHLLAVAVILITGYFLSFGKYDWIAVTICIGMVFTAEAMNTAIENLADHVSPDIHPKIKIIKDVAAAGVLLSAIIAVVVALLVIFG